MIEGCEKNKGPVAVTEWRNACMYAVKNIRKERHVGSVGGNSKRRKNKTRPGWAFASARSVQGAREAAHRCVEQSFTCGRGKGKHHAIGT